MFETYRAIKNIKKLKSELPEEGTNHFYILRLATVIGNYFGLKSNEYMNFQLDTSGNFKPISEREFINSKSREAARSRQKKYVADYLDACIENLKASGVYKKEVPNFLGTIKNEKLIALLLTFSGILVASGMFFGRYYSDADNSSLRNTNSILTDSLIFYRQAHAIAHEKTNKDTASTKPVQNKAENGK